MKFLVHRDIGLFEETIYDPEKDKDVKHCYHAEVSDDNPPTVTTVRGVNGVTRFKFGEHTSELLYSFYEEGSWVEVSRGKLLENTNKRRR